MLASLINATKGELAESHKVCLAHGECRVPFTTGYFPVVPFAPLTPAERVILLDLAPWKEWATVSELVPAVMAAAAGAGNVAAKESGRKDVVKAGWSVKVLEGVRLVCVHKAGTTKAVSITPEVALVAATLEMLGKSP